MAEAVMTDADHAAQAGSKPQRPAIELTCPDAGDASSHALCEALLLELQGRGGAPLSVRLRISDDSPTHMTAHLEWQRRVGSGAAPDWTTGPDLTFSVSDRTLSPAMMTRFARDLVTVSVLPE